MGPHKIGVNSLRLLGHFTIRQAGGAYQDAGRAQYFGITDPRRPTMAVTAIAAGASPQSNPFVQTRQAFGQLSNALQSGNLSAAQSAYNTLAASPLAQNGPFAAAIQQIGQDLASGNLADAQKALASLPQQQQQKAHGHHHHGGGESEGAKDSSSSSSNSATTSTRDADGDGYDDVTGAPIDPAAASSSSKQAIDVKV
jgi:hypothetical protein